MAEQTITTGHPDVAPDTPSHTGGTREGNQPGRDLQPGHARDGTSTARRSTGIRPGDRDPIVPGAPNLSPA